MDTRPPTSVLVLTDTIVIRNLSHPLNLSLKFLKDCQAKLDYMMAAPQLHIKGEQIPIVTQLETLETTVESEKTQSKPEEEQDLEELAAQLGQADLEERTHLPGKGQLPPDQISVFNSLRQQYAINFFLHVKFYRLWVPQNGSACLVNRE